MSERGAVIDRVTQQWVRATGRRLRLADVSWLEGPHGAVDRIGLDYFESRGKALGLKVVVNAPGAGLMSDFGELSGDGFDASAVDDGVRDFYQRTTAYELDLWSKWSPSFRPFGGAVIGTFSRRLQQLNLPLSPLESSGGMKSNIVQLLEPKGERALETGWVREMITTRQVVYVGSYSIARVPGHPGPCVRVVFPLPNGNATVILKPRLGEGGALELLSGGERFGDPGFYLVVYGEGDTVWARYVRSFREHIRVYRDELDRLVADHHFSLFGLRALELKYRMRLGAPA